MASPFSPETREANLDTLAAGEFDLLVIGGGITGAGVARDAALRGLRVALVERNDFSAGTSSRSSKLIHGGVRYLQQAEIGLVREAAAERDVLGRIAPHLALPRRMVMPTYSRGMHAKLAVGLWTFDKLAGIKGDERHETWARDETLTHEPLLEGKRLADLADASVPVVKEDQATGDMEGFDVSSVRKTPRSAIFTKFGMRPSRMNFVASPGSMPSSPRMTTRFACACLNGFPTRSQR